MPTAGRIVAALSFGFWTAMFGPHYEGLWRKALHRIAAKPDGTRLRRKDFSGPLTSIRTIRNRIAHHEPIIAWDLPEIHKKMVELTRWLSPAAAAWCRENDRFEHVYPAERILLARIREDAPPRLIGLPCAETVFRPLDDRLIARASFANPTPGPRCFRRLKITPAAHRARAS